MKYKFLSVFLLAFALMCRAPAWAEYNTHKNVLNNGLTVLITEMPSSPKIAVYCLVKAGSATEGEFMGSGISHFLEHMLFKETQTRKVGEIASYVQSVGGTINASTSFDYTIYTIDVPDTEFDNALSILADMMQHAVFNPEEFKKEQEVIFGEMRLHEDNPDRVLGQLSYSTIYTTHPYQYPVIGYRDIFSKLTHHDLKTYYDRYYVPTNMVFSVAGNVKAGDIFPKIEAAFNAAELSLAPPRNLPQEPLQVARREIIKEFPTELTRLSMDFAGIRLSDKDLYALDVLSNILGDGQSSRLYKNILKDKKLVHQIGSWNYTPIDRGFFEIEALMENDRREVVEAAIWAEIKNIQDKGVPEAELEKAKKNVIAGHIYGLQSSSGVAYSQAIDQAFSGDEKFSYKYVKRIQQLKKEDIKRAALKYLNEDALSVSVLIPVGSADSMLPEKPSAASQEDIEKIVLENGITVLLKEDKSLPVVLYRLTMYGGLLREPEGLEGISQLTSNVWVKATTSKPSDALSKIVESNGMRVGAVSGKNSLGFFVQALSEDSRLAFNIFEDIFKNAVFAQEDIELAKKQTLAALKTRKDNIFSYTNLKLNEALFAGHPYGHDSLGSEASVLRMDREKIVSFYDSLRNPEDIVISVFGDINKIQVLGSLKKSFGLLKSKGSAFDFPEAPVLSERKEIALTLNRQQAVVMVGFRAPSLKDNDRYSAEMLAEVLGSSFSGRLFAEIREKLGKAYSVGGQYIPGINAGAFIFYALTDEASAKEIEEVMSREFEQLKNLLVTDKEFADVKSYLAGSFKSGLETNSSLSLMTSLDELYDLGFDAYKDYESQLGKVSKEDIQKAAQKYLDVSRAVVVVTRPGQE